MEALTRFEVLTDFTRKILYTLRDFCLRLYDWLLEGIEFTIPVPGGDPVYYSLTGLDLLGAFAVTWFVARVVATIIDSIIPN